MPELIDNSPEQTVILNLWTGCRPMLYARIYIVFASETLEKVYAL